MNNYLRVERLLHIIEEDLGDLMTTLKNIIALSDNEEGVYQKGLENVVVGMLYLLALEENKDVIIEDLLTYIENNRTEGEKWLK